MSYQETVTAGELGCRLLSSNLDSSVLVVYINTFQLTDTEVQHEPTEVKGDASSYRTGSSFDNCRINEPQPWGVRGGTQHLHPSIHLSIHLSIPLSILPSILLSSLFVSLSCCPHLHSPMTSLCNEEHGHRLPQLCKPRAHISWEESRLALPGSCVRPWTDPCLQGVRVP